MSNENSEFLTKNLRKLSLVYYGCLIFIALVMVLWLHAFDKIVSNVEYVFGYHFIAISELICVIYTMHRLRYRCRYQRGIFYMSDVVMWNDPINIADTCTRLLPHSIRYIIYPFVVINLITAVVSYWFLFYSVSFGDVIWGIIIGPVVTMLFSISSTNKLERHYCAPIKQLEKKILDA